MADQPTECYCRPLRHAASMAKMHSPFFVLCPATVEGTKVIPSPALAPSVRKWLLAPVSGSGATLFRSVWDTAGFSCSRGLRQIILQQLRAVLAHKGRLCLKRPLSVHQHQLTPTAQNYSYKPPLYTSTAHTHKNRQCTQMVHILRQ